MNYIFKKIYILILFIGILITLTLSYYTYHLNIEKEQIRFNSLSKNAIQQIQNRMDTYREVLYSSGGFFEASTNVSREEWHFFVNKLQLKKYFPGIQGLGYSVVLRKDEIEKNIIKIRKEGFPSYKIHPEGKRELYTSVIYIEPFSQRNQQAFGYDMYSEVNRRKAMNRTIETGLPTLSNKVKLVQENNKDIQSGFLLYTALYKKNMPLDTKEQRYEAIKGFIYAVFRTKDFIHGAVGNTLETLDIKMYDSKIKNKTTLLFDSNKDLNTSDNFINNIELNLDGHLWTFQISADDSYLDSEGYIYTIIFIVLGFLVTFLVALLIKKQGEFEILKDDALFNVSQGVMVTNKQREIVYTNKAFEDLTGYKRETIYGKNAHFLQGEDTDKNSINFIKEQISKLIPFECEILNYKKDGSSFWNRLAVTPILDEKNEIKHYIGIQNDITEKKILEKNMLFEKNLIENILSNTNAIIALIDMNGIMLKLNDYGKDLVGYTQEEISSKPYFWKKFTPSRMKDDIENIIKKAQKNELIEKNQNSWISKNGEEKIFEWSNQLIKNDYGETEYLITVGIDVTNDAIAQEQHKKYQKQLALSAEISGLAFWELNLKTNIFTLNDFYYTFLGTSIKEEGSYQLEMKKYLDSFIPKTSQSIIRNALSLAFSKNKDYQDSFEYEMIRKDGLMLQVLVNYFISYDEEGNPNKAYGTKYNLTKQKQKEKILIEAKQKAENASKAKTEFLANMSHEIRTPLNGIIGLTNLALQTQLTDIQENYLRKSMISSKALLHVINDILDYSKLEVNKIKLESISFEIDKMLHEISNLFTYEAQNKNIQLDCTLDPFIPNNLIGDPFRITQILINLVGNAIKFTHQGFIKINVKLEEINETIIKLVFSIKDTGIGISKEKQKKLFQNFSQVDASNTREYGGTGLGLVISQKLAKIMGGEISVQSKEKEGSTFKFTSLVNYTKKDYRFLSQDLKNKKVLIINDKEDINNSLEKTLKIFTINSTICETEEEASNILEYENFDYIIIESQLKGKDVIEFTKYINNTYNHKDIKLIIMTSFDKEDKLINRTKKEGIQKDKILIRPFSSSTLLDILVNHGKVKLSNEKNEKKLEVNGIALLVEDNEINQLVAKQNLENFGIEVHIAENGAIAVKKVKDTKFDIIFMDLQMPVMDGFESTKEIRKFNSDIPIIALSAAVMDEDLKMTQEAGMNEHLSKPIEIHKLKEIVSKYLNTTSVQISNVNDDENIEEIKGVNFEELLHRLNNNKKLCYQVLSNFAKDKKDIIKEIDSLDIQSKEFSSLMHNIKGLSGNLSLYNVFKYSTGIYTATILENKTKYLSKLKDSLTIVLTSINEKIISKVEVNNNSNNFTKEKILKNIKKVALDISQGAFISQDEKHKIIDQIIQIHNKDIANELEGYLSNFDYENAEKILKRIIGELE